MQAFIPGASIACTMRLTCVRIAGRCMQALLTAKLAAALTPELRRSCLHSARVERAHAAQFDREQARKMGVAAREANRNAKLEAWRERVESASLRMRASREMREASMGAPERAWGQGFY